MSTTGKSQDRRVMREDDECTRERSASFSFGKKCREKAVKGTLETGSRNRVAVLSFELTHGKGGFVPWDMVEVCRGLPKGKVPVFP